MALLAGKERPALRLATLPSGSRHATVLDAAASLVAGFGAAADGQKVADSAGQWIK